MKHKNLLFVVLFLTMFVFQQVRAGGTISSIKNVSQKNVVPSNANTLVGFYRVYMYGLIPGGADAGNILPSHQLCQWPTDMQGSVYGCGNNPNFANPSDQNNPSNSYWIVAEDYYLKNVIALEMNLDELRPPELEALKAQAVAARTVANYKTDRKSVV